MKSFLSSKLCDHLTLVVIAAILTTSAHAILDENQNGLSDVWEKQYNNNALFPPEFSPTTDPDQDGWNNLTESIAGTNPNNATPPHGILKPHIQPNPAQGFFHIDHSTILGKNYQLQGSPDLLSWLTISDATLAHEEQLNHVSAVSTTAGIPPERFFWRVNITDNDFDNDGLTDAEEIILQTNPYHNDTDNDGIHDKAELLRALDPLNPDTDNDRLYDGQEDILTTHPLNPDTDSDGIQDGDEIANGTNPLLADTDGDGLNDLQEKTLSTNPLLADTDGDGINDAQEIINGTSPLTNDTDLDGIPDNIDNTPLTNNVIANPDYVGLSTALLNGLTSLWDFENLQNITANGSTSLAYANLINASHPALYYGPTVSNDGLISRSADYQTANHSLIAPPQVFSGKTNWTISFWYKITQGSIQNKTGTLNTVLWAYNNGNGSNNNDTTPEFQVHAYKALTAQDSQKLIISHYHNGTLQPDLVTLIPQNDPLDNDTWQHLTITKNNGTIKVYRNAAQLNQFTTSAASYTATSTGYFALGRLHQSTTADTALRGKLDRFTIHNRALSSTEVTALVDIDSDKDGLFDRVETATKLWRDTNTNGLADPGETTFQNDPFRAQPNNRDTDGDGLTDIQEQTLGTQISLPDSDGDLIPDGWEVSHSLNPLSAADAQLDNDIGGPDGLNNLDEYRHNSDPKKRDTDDDGILDGPEAKGPDGNLATDDGSNPNDASDNGTRPPASELLALKLGVGDRSGSHSEDYVLNVFQLQPDGSEKRLYTLRSGGFGQYTEQTRSFPKTHTYTFQIDWQGTNNNAQSPGSANAEGADFDYHLVIEPLSGHQSHILIDSYDPKTKTVDPATPLRDPEDINPADDDNDDVTTFLETHEPKRVVLLHVEVFTGITGETTLHHGQFIVSESVPMPELILNAPTATLQNGIMLVQLTGTVKDAVSIHSQSGERRPLRIKFATNDLPRKTITVPVITDSTGVNFSTSFEIPNVKSSGYVIRATTSPNIAGQTAFDEAYINVAAVENSTPANQIGNLNLAFTAAPSATNLDSLRIYDGDRAPLNTDALFTETEVNSRIYEGHYQGKLCLIKILALTELSTSVTDASGAKIIFAPSTTNQEIHYAKIHESAANSLRFRVQAWRFAQSKLSVNETGTLRGSIPAGIDPCGIAITGLPLNVSGGSSFQIRSGNITYDLIQIGDRWYPQDPRAPNIPKKFCPSTVPLPQSLQASGYDQENGKLEFRLVCPGGVEIPLPSLHVVPSTTTIAAPAPEQGTEDPKYWSPGRPLKKYHVTSAYRFIFADNIFALELLDAFERGGHQVDMGNVLWDLDEDVKINQWHTALDNIWTIQIEKHLDSPVEAALLLFEGLKNLSCHQEIFDDYQFDDLFEEIGAFKAATDSAVATAKTATVAAAELYLSGLCIVNEGLDWMIIANDVSEGQYSSLAGMLPLVPSGLVKANGALKIRTKLGRSLENLNQAQFAALKDASLAKNLATIGTVMDESAFDDFIRKTLAADNGPLAANQIGGRGILKSNMGDPPGPGYHAHHDFPWDLRNWFANKGIDVNEAAYGRWVKRDEHLPWHGRAGGEFNQWWKDVISAEEEGLPNGIPALTKDEVLEKLAEVRALFPASP